MTKTKANAMKMVIEDVIGDIRRNIHDVKPVSDGASSENTIDALDAADTKLWQLSRMMRGCELSLVGASMAESAIGLDTDGHIVIMTGRDTMRTPDGFRHLGVTRRQHGATTV